MTVKQFVQSITRAGNLHSPNADLQPTVEWRVNGFCNYDCSYCIQSKASRVGVPDDETIDNIIGEFARLPGQWEIKMSGGEPFAFKGFVGLVIPELIRRTDHLVSVLT
ncbi:MAG: radical SAM protein, partial [Pirellulaceae bacterium]|nr:radical SAM protein [Pirellulaceae bacterium]